MRYNRRRRYRRKQRQSRLITEDLTDTQQLYRDFFQAMLEIFGVNSQAELSEDERSDFFNFIQLGWDNDATSLDNRVNRGTFNAVAAYIDMDMNDVEDILADYDL